jgi:2'-5' RNA ligase
LWRHKGLFILTGPRLRTFIAVDLSDAIRGELGTLLRSFRRFGADIRWSPEENLHLTLKFLGDTPELKMGEIGEALGAVAAGQGPFSAAFGGLGAFPESGDPRILWTGLVTGREEMTRLALAVETQMARLGFAKEERPFSPHLTLGRVRSSKNLDSFLRAFRETEYRSGLSMPVDHLTFYQSILTPEGSVYRAIQKVDFKQQRLR